MDDNLGEVIIWAVLLALIVLLVAFWPGAARGDQVPKWEAVYCLIGEAEGEGPAGMSAVAFALRARGTTKGVFGCQSPRVKGRLYSSKTLVQAVKAWEESRPGSITGTIDPTNGANHWLSVEDMVQHPSWLDFCEYRAKVGRHFFYYCN